MNSVNYIVEFELFDGHTTEMRKVDVTFPCETIDEKKDLQSIPVDALIEIPVFQEALIESLQTQKNIFVQVDNWNQKTLVSTKSNPLFHADIQVKDVKHDSDFDDRVARREVLLKQFFNQR